MEVCILDHRLPDDLWKCGSGEQCDVEFRLVTSFIRIVTDVG
jgi:hypothetical protein